MTTRQSTQVLDAVRSESGVGVSVRTPAPTRSPTTLVTVSVPVPGLVSESTVTVHCPLASVLQAVGIPTTAPASVASFSSLVCPTPLSSSDVPSTFTTGLNEPSGPSNANQRARAPPSRSRRSGRVEAWMSASP